MPDSEDEEFTISKHHLRDLAGESKFTHGGQRKKLWPEAEREKFKLMVTKHGNNPKLIQTEFPDKTII